MNLRRSYGRGLTSFLYASIDIEKSLCESVDVEDLFVCRYEHMDIVDIVYLVAWISRGFLSG